MIPPAVHYGLIAVGALVCAYFLGIFTGAHYVPTSDERVERMLRLAKIKPGEKLVDIGSGDGRFLIEAAKQGADAVGYEINPLLIPWSRVRAHRAGVSNNVRIYWRDFWHQDFSDFDIVTVYCIPHMMARLERKLLRELRPGARVVSNAFPFPHWPGSQEGRVYLYVKE
jgi:cyclopropane fatty-acyl-phospholipid synthase-like methyltransferase